MTFKSILFFTALICLGGLVSCGDPEQKSLSNDQKTGNSEPKTENNDPKPTNAELVELIGNQFFSDNFVFTTDFIKNAARRQSLDLDPATSQIKQVNPNSALKFKTKRIEIISATLNEKHAEDFSYIVKFRLNAFGSISYGMLRNFYPTNDQFGITDLDLTVTATKNVAGKCTVHDLKPTSSTAETNSNPLRNPQTPEEVASCVKGLCVSIWKSESIWQMTGYADVDGNGRGEYTPLSNLISSQKFKLIGGIDTILAKGTAYGYTFKVEIPNAKEQQKEQYCWIYAIPNDKANPSYCAEFLSNSNGLSIHVCPANTTIPPETPINDQECIDLQNRIQSWNPTEVWPFDTSLKR